MKALGLVVSEKKIFLCFSHDATRGPCGPQGHCWQDLLERLFHNLVLNFIGAIVYLSPTPMGEVSPNLGINEILGK